MKIITCLACGKEQPRVFVTDNPSRHTCSATCRNMVNFGLEEEPRTEPGNLGLPPATGRF
jgi:hypothetical protein